MTDPDRLTKPDPSAMTTAALDRATGQREALVTAQLAIRDARLSGATELVLARVEALSSTLTTRLDGMDKANDVLAENVNRVPTNLQSAVAQLKELENVKFDSIAKQFEQNERQTAREKAAADLALAAAFSAADKAAAATNSANSEAIRKSEGATAETINKLEQTVTVQLSSLNDKVEDAKSSSVLLRTELTASIAQLRTELIQFQSRSIGGQDQRVDSRAVNQNVFAFIGAVVAIVLVGITVFAALKP